MLSLSLPVRASCEGIGDLGLLNITSHNRSTEPDSLLVRLQASKLKRENLPAFWFYEMIQASTIERRELSKLNDVDTALARLTLGNVQLRSTQALSHFPLRLVLSLAGRA